MDFKISVAVFFGGKSVEHEISIISALQAINNIDTDRYTVTPVYITRDNEMYTSVYMFDLGEFADIPQLLKKSNRVTIVNEGDRVYLHRIEEKKRVIQLTQDSADIIIDVALPVVHGVNVEDGSLQGFLRMKNLPFAGCDVLASALCMNKYMSKQILLANGVPALLCVRVDAADYYQDEREVCKKIVTALGFPVIIKPIDLGSSVGISIAKTGIELMNSLELAFSFSKQVIVEHAVRNLKEINCSVLGDEDGCLASECEEPISNGEVLDYARKYMSAEKNERGEIDYLAPKLSADSDKSDKGMASLKRKLPADIDEKMRSRIMDIAKKAFMTLGCSGVVRIDFIIDMDTNNVYLNEINTIPGSLSYYLWEYTGIPFNELLDRLIKIALKRHRRQGELTYTFDSQVLKLMPKGGKFGSKFGKLS